MFKYFTLDLFICTIKFSEQFGKERVILSGSVVTITRSLHSVPLISSVMISIRR